MASLEYTSHRNELAIRIRTMRMQRGYSTRGFSTMIGISKTYLNKVEAAKASPTFDMLERIAAGLDISLSDLVHFEPACNETTSQTIPHGKRLGRHGHSQPIPNR